MAEDSVAPERMCLYLDDVRTPTCQIPGYAPWIVVRDYEAFRMHLIHKGIPHLISFDHDLGEEHYKDYADQVVKMGWQAPDYENYKEKTGMDAAKFLCEMFVNVPEREDLFPVCGVHSHNPVGNENIRSYINGFKKHMGWTANAYAGQVPFTLEKI